MTSGPSMCPDCVRLTGETGWIDETIPTGTCAAFPDGIPLAIFAGGFDHRKPYPGDGGVTYLAATPPTP